MLEKGFLFGIASPAGIMSSGPPALPYAFVGPIVVLFNFVVMKLLITMCIYIYMYICIIKTFGSLCTYRYIVVPLPCW